MTLPPTQEVVCPSCGTAGSSRFCANCGASLEAVTCSGCDTPLGPGAKFCHRCGRPAGDNPNVAISAAAGSGVASSLPWIVAAIALVTLLAFFAGNAFNSKRASTLDAPQNALPQAGLDDRGSVAAGQGGMGSPRGPDLTQISPQEQAERLFNRVMMLNSQGKTDSVQFFAPMAIGAYERLTPLTPDHRYDMGRIAEVAGVLPIARAQADTILRQNPVHLLGLILGARVATLSNEAAGRKIFETRLLAAYDAESKRRLPEYERHEDDITNALAVARGAAGNTR